MVSNESTRRFRRISGLIATISLSATTQPCVLEWYEKRPKSAEPSSRTQRRVASLGLVSRPNQSHGIGQVTMMFAVPKMGCRGSAWRNGNSSRVLGSDEYLPSSDDGDGGTRTIAQGCIRQCGQDAPRQQGNGCVVGSQNYDYHLIPDMLLPAKFFAHQHATFLPDRGAHWDSQEGNQKQQIRDHAMIVELLQQLEPTPLPE
jgi:hypothetical protein